MKTSWMGSERKPYRIKGLPASHGELIHEHVKNLSAKTPGGNVDIDSYEPEASCGGPVVYHGELVVDSMGTMIPHWFGSATHVEVVCEECFDVWTVETDYCRVLKSGAAGIELEDQGPPDIPW